MDRAGIVTVVTQYDPKKPVSAIGAKLQERTQELLKKNEGK